MDSLFIIILGRKRIRKILNKLIQGGKDMLVLQRHEGETITIDHMGETLTLSVVETRDGKVRLGFEGPESFEIWREEVTSSE